MTARDTALRHVSSHLATPEQQDAARDVLGAGWIDTRHMTDTELHEVFPPDQYRLTVFTQYRRWLMTGMKTASFAVIFAGGMLFGMWLAVFQMVAM